MLVAHDDDTGDWHPIGDVTYGSPHQLDYTLWDGEPAWETLGG